ncbi:MAG TPA: hemerythrin domain-containing protein [Woeseiaceae bacterium]|nr:hemerythrin domain-containing protein [Woeseiaceae bacterium]
MSGDIAAILGLLRQDHKNLTWLLALMAQEAERLGQAGASDFDCLRDIMHYLDVYPDAVHHPTEDCLLGELRSVRPDLATGLKGLLPEHRRISELGHKIRNELASIQVEAGVRREILVADLEDYVATLTKHIEWEDQNLFPCFEVLVNVASPSAAQRIMHVVDPLFGSQPSATYSRLLHHLQFAYGR